MPSCHLCGIEHPGTSLCDPCRRSVLGSGTGSVLLTGRRWGRTHAAAREVLAVMQSQVQLETGPSKPAPKQPKPKPKTLWERLLDDPV